MTLKTRRLAPAIGVEILDFDLGRDLDNRSFDQLDNLFNEHGLLLLRGQTLTEQQHVDLSRRFGQLQEHVLKPFLLPGYPQILRITNIEVDGKPIGISDAGRFWHSDTSYIAHPCRCSLLYSIEVPAPAGERTYGDTVFASLTSAYDALDEATRKRIATLRSEHSFGKHYKRMQEAGSKRPDLTPEQEREVPKVVHPIVRPHPITGRKAIFVNDGYTTHVVGLPQDESDALVERLTAHSVRPEFTYRHQWRAGDLLIWDNNATQHLAIADYKLPQRRLMHRTTVLPREGAAAH